MRILDCALGVFVFSSFQNVETRAENYVVTTTTVVSAQDQAEACARTGRLTHCRVLHGRREGIGFSTASPIQAEKSACFYGRYRIVERGYAWSPIRRGWFAVIRYAD